jgi:diguanylate cyclase (GGDEF)-like protein/PAS domain S-box-containing protein
MEKSQTLSAPEKSPDDFFLTLISNVHDGIYFLDKDQKITFWNQATEQITGYKGQEAVGKSCSEGLLSHVNEKGIILCFEHCPAKETLKDGKVRTVDTFVHHKEGYRLPVSLSVYPRRNPGGEIVGTAQVFHSLSPKLLVPQKGEELDHMALLDPLTGLGNKRYLEILLHSRLNELSLYRFSMGVIFVDIDNLKSVNETYGTEVGDKVLKMVSQTLANNVRFYEAVGRWGDEEFVVTLLNADEHKLSLVANKLRVLVANSNILVEPNLISVTVSMGATIAVRYDSVESLINRAEQLMLQSKWLGRNRVSLKPVVK